MQHSRAQHDVAIVGAGLAGLATALALYKRDSTLRIAIVSPEFSAQDKALGFGSNQPAIASHPHFSKDHNLLSQWTSFCLPENDRVLNAAFECKPAIAPARGRWVLAQTSADATDLKARIEVFNAKVDGKFQAFWQANTGAFGAVWLPSAWAVAPLQLQGLWVQQLQEFGCVFLNGYAIQASWNQGVTVHYKTESGETSFSANKLVICSPASLHALIRSASRIVPIAECLPLVRWPGQSQLELSPERSALFGSTTVQEKSYAIALGNNDWLVRDELEIAAKPFRGERWHSPDRLPFLGLMFDGDAIAANAMGLVKNDVLPLPKLENVYLNTAHGTRGLLSGIAGASVVADMLSGINTPMPQALSNALNPNRYVRRALREHFANLQSNHDNQ